MLQAKEAPITQPKVMIVEDEAIIARDIQRQLVRLGFAVTGTAPSAADAFQAIEQRRPDIVLMDVRLKGDMDGIQAADVVRGRFALPVVYLTAHADEATLQRAQITRSFGYIVKPLGRTNIKATITMALYNHRAERELENERALLSTVLQGIPDAVLAAEPCGQIVFLNVAAEQITGWKHQDAIGNGLRQVAPIHDRDGRAVSANLLQQALARGTPLRIPRDSALIGKDGNVMEISGQLAATTFANGTERVFLTLQDVTFQKSQDQRLRQEQQMFVAGELAHDIGREFYALFDLIENAADPMLENRPGSDEKREVELIRKASRIGVSMSTQLLELRDGHGAAHVVNVNEYLLASQSLLERVCGSGIRLSISSAPDVGYVISTGNHIEQMLSHLVLEGRQRIDGQGTLSIRADVHTQPISPSRSGSYVRFLVTAEASAADIDVTAADPFPLGRESSEFGLGIVRAIAIVSEGFTRVAEPTDLVSVIEVFLPRHGTRSAATAVTNEYSHVILLIGLQPTLAESLRNAVGENVLLVEAASLDDAALISELYTGDIDLVVLEEDHAPKTKDLARDRIHARRPNISFLEIPSTRDPSKRARLAANGLETSDDVERQVKNLLSTQGMRSIASAG